MLKAQENVEGANENIVEAEIQQKKSKKKCYILIFIVLIAVILLAGAYFILRPTWLFISLFLQPNLYTNIYSHILNSQYNNW